MAFEDIVNFISSVGFPIGVSCFCLYKMQDTQESIVNMLSQLSESIDKIYSKLLGGE